MGATRLATHLRRICDVLAGAGVGFEVVPVSDGSSDGSEAAFYELPGELVRPIVWSDNRGKGEALRIGLAHGHGRYLGFIDGDGDIPTDGLAQFVAVVCPRAAAGVEAACGWEHAGKAAGAGAAPSGLGGARAAADDRDVSRGVPPRPGAGGRFRRTRLRPVRCVASGGRYSSVVSNRSGRRRPALPPAQGSPAYEWVYRVIADSHTETGRPGLTGCRR